MKWPPLAARAATLCCRSSRDGLSSTWTQTWSAELTLQHTGMMTELRS